MVEKNIKSRIVHKHDTEINWQKATNFIPLKGELIIYEKDTNYSYPRFKVGDGETNINDLPFTTEALEHEIFKDTTLTIGLNEIVPDTAMPSICDFTLIPKTKIGVINVNGDNRNYFKENKVFYQKEVPLVTTRGKIKVLNSNNEIEYEKTIDELINYNGTFDIMYNDKIIKKWSERFYITREPDFCETINTGTGSANTSPNWIFGWIFKEKEFEELGLPMKAEVIPLVSPVFLQPKNNPQDYINNRALSYAEPVTVWFTYNEGDEDNEPTYVLTCKLRESTRKASFLYQNTPGYFCYQLAEEKILEDNLLSLYLEQGYKVEFEQDDLFDSFWEYSITQDWCPWYDENYAVWWKPANLETNRVEATIDTTPTLEALVSSSVINSLQSIGQLSKELNKDFELSIDIDDINNYAWIGDADESIDYTEKIQNKINEIYNTKGQGSVYLGKGTYNISNSLILYGGICLIGQGDETIIKQSADYTHAIVISGNHVGVEKLQIKLVGNCDGTQHNLSTVFDQEVIGCIYVNSNNMSDLSHYNSKYPENYYCQHILIRDVSLMGTYSFDFSNGKAAFPENKETYKGCGIVVPNLYFNYAHIDNVRMDRFFAGYYGQGGSNIVNIYCTGSKIMVCDHNKSGYNNFTIKGHPYYSNDQNGNIISLSDYVVYSNADGNNYDIAVFDQQWFKNVAYFDTHSMNNKYNINQFAGGYLGFVEADENNTLELFVKNLGRGNVNISPFVSTPFHIGSRQYNLSGQTEFKSVDPVIGNSLSGVGIWGSITSNITWNEYQLTLQDVCRYPKDFDIDKNLTHEAGIVSEVSPSVENPIEILIDMTNRPVGAFPNLYIQFKHEFVAEDFSIEFYTLNDTLYKRVDVVDNKEIVFYCNYNQNETRYIYKIKLIITKALEIENLAYRNSAYTQYTIHYNPNKLVGICNIGMTSSEYAGRAFLGAYGDSMYGDLDMCVNKISNVATPTNDLDSANKQYVDNKISNYYTKEEVDLRLGNIDLALDSIIEIQNSFMPGGTPGEPNVPGGDA